MLIDQSIRRSRRNTLVRRRAVGASASRAVVEHLEYRRLLSTSILGYHGNDSSSDGDNLTETLLSPSDVNVNTFGKLASTPLDGVAVAEPLYDPGVSITAGSATGTHNVVFVATETDSLYAIDSGTGAVLWKDSFLVAEPALTATGASVTVSTVLSSDVNSSDTPIIGITGTPAIDPATNSLYVIAKTKQIVNGATTTPHFVQVLYKVNLSSGVYTSTVIADTTYNTSNSAYTYNSGPYVLDPHGAGSGVVTATVNGTSQKVVYFNALRSFSRVGVTLSNGNVYLGFASHGDNAPYHGWILGYSESTLAATAVFNANPDGGDDGIWGGGGKIAVDASGNLYVETGNGTFDTTLNSSGFPVYGDYGDAFIKITPDPTSTVTSQNINGWGLKVTDYFTPYNQAALSSADQDEGSGSPMLLPATAGGITIGSAAAPNLLVGAGKDGNIYLLNTSNMGKYSSTTNNVVQEISGGVSGGGSYDTPSFFYNGSAAYVIYGGKAAPIQEYTIANGVMSGLVSASTMTIGSFGSTVEISANGVNNGIAWVVDGTSGTLRAFNPTNLTQQYYNSDQDSSRDALGTTNKFETCTVADGEVFVANTNSLVIYGLVSLPTSVPTAPTSLKTTVISNSQINLTWTDTATNAFGYYVDEKTVTSNTWVQVGSTGSTGTSYGAVGLAPGTAYDFEVQAFNALGTSAFTSVAVATTTNTTVSPSFPSGFNTSNTAGELMLNGSAELASNTLEITNGANGEASSAFTENAVSVQGFTTTFTLVDTSANADGLTYTMQNQGPNAIGGSGGDLGYGGSPGITPSVAIKFDLYSNNGEGTDSTGLFVYGDPPEEPTGAYSVEKSYDMTSSGVVLNSGDPMLVNLSYNGTVLTETVTDTTLNKTFTQAYTINIPQFVGGGYAYVGFTGGTGGASAIQQIKSWTYGPVAVAPYTPVNFTVTPASGTELDLAWNEPYSAVSNFNVQELESGTYVQIAQVPGTLTNFNATGLSEGTTYSFKVVAVNSAGSSAPTAAVSATTPVPPADVTNLTYSNVTATGATITWTNVATNATSIEITRTLESNNSQYLTRLSATSTSYTDTMLLPGRAYDYEVVVFSLAGPSDGVDVIPETIPDVAATPTAMVTGTAITLNWADYGHAVSSYNVYRSLTPGGEGTKPYATGIAGDSFTDTGLTNGVTYYYTITAVDTGGEGPQSGEASGKIVYAPVTITTPDVYLKLDADQTHLDVWNNTTASGTATQYVLSDISSLSVAGPAGNDLLFVDLSSGNPLPASGLTVTSAGVEVIGVGAASGTISFSLGGSTIGIQTAAYSTAITYSNTAAITVAAGTGTDTLTQTAQPGGGASLLFSGTTISDTLNVNAGTYTIPAGTSSGINHATLGSLSIAAGAKVVVTTPASETNRTLLTVGALSIAGTAGNYTGRLDLGGNDLDVRSSTLTAVTNLVQSGFALPAGAPWTGTGIDSSAAAADSTHTTALGVIQNGSLYSPGSAKTFDGTNPAATDILVKFTFTGDANLDGKIDGSDYSLIDTGYAAPGSTGWANGDFNYDSVVDGTDYALIDNAFNNQTPSLGVAALTAQTTASVAPVVVPVKTAPAGPVTTRPVFAASAAATVPAVSRRSETGRPAGAFTPAADGPVRPVFSGPTAAVPLPAAYVGVSPFYQGKHKAMKPVEDLSSDVERF
jgi:hypothetical protein